MKLIRWCDTMVSDAIKNDILVRAGRKIIDSLERLIGHAMKFKGGVKCYDSIRSKFTRHRVSVHRRSRQGTCIDSLCQLSYSALALEPIEHVGE